MQTQLFGTTKKPSKKERSYERFNGKLVDYTLVDTSEKLDELIATLQRFDRFAFDTETDSVEPVDANLVGISFATDSGIAWYVPTNTLSLSLGEIKKKVAPIFSNDALKIAHNYKFDHQILHFQGIEIQGDIFDTMVAGYLIDNSQRVKMDKLSRKYLDYAPISIDGLLEGDRTMFDVPISEVSTYACEDADVTFRLYEYFKDRLRDDQMKDLANKIEFPTTKALSQMEINGITLNSEFLHGFHEELQEEIQGMLKDMERMAGRKFNPNSPQQVGKILFGVLGLPVISYTDTGNKGTGEDVLNKLKHRHEFPQKLLDYRQLSKLDSTYVKALPNWVSKKTGRVHTHFNQTVTATGRLSSSKPNLQNIPIRSEKGRKVRRAFTAEKGYTLLNADYSQMELRIIASICQDETMLSIFENGEDIHSGTASAIFDVPIEDVKYDQRYQAKTINYAIPYGADYPKIARELEIHESKAKSLLDMYFHKFKRVKEYIEAQHEFAKKYGYVQTRFGRRRYLPNINSSNQWKRFESQRQAVNTPIQGESADLMKLAMIGVNEWLIESEADAKLLLQVHDEIVMEVPHDEKIYTPIAEKVVSIMENVHDIGVDLDVDYGIAPTWEEGH